MSSLSDSTLGELIKENSFGIFGDIHLLLRSVLTSNDLNSGICFAVIILLLKKLL